MALALVHWKLQVMTRILALVVPIYLSLIGIAAAQDAERLSRAMDLLRAEKWTEAARQAGKSGSINRDIVEWHRLREGLGSDREIMAFLERRPDWPGLPYLRRRGELPIAEADTVTILQYYAKSRPQTAEGALSLARALIATGKRGDGEAEAVLAWRTMPMGGGLQAQFLEDFGRVLKRHHAARLNRMLWDGHRTSARGMLPLVNAGQRKLAEARIALQERTPGVDAKIEAVPGRLSNDPGLAYDRFRWRDAKKRREDSIVLMLERSDSAKDLGEPEKWSRRRRDLARQDMRDGNNRRAYRLAARHHMTPDAGYAYSDLEWLAGYIALRKLGDAKTAARHFERFAESVQSPISQGRAGYWRGRAYEAMGQVAAAQSAYSEAAGFQSSFYGLLAAERIGRPFDPALANPPAVPSWRKAAFLKSSVAQAGLLLLSAGELDLAERFLTHLTESLDDAEAQQIGQMALDLNEPHLALMIAKRAARTGLVLPGAYFPLHGLSDRKLPMAKEMSLAIARRESEFDFKVISGAGARGLMQVMPATAKKVAGDLGILSEHSTSRLTRDWRYNAQLGANYLAELAAEFDGNVIMMAAGYNAGPGRPVTWMGRYGDPRDGTPDIVDWIEHIPFNETRNYVMRVSESLPVYRARLGKTALPIPFSHELIGSTLRAFAP